MIKKRINTMKPFFIISILLITLKAFSQDCNFKVDSTNKASGQLEIQTQEVLLHEGSPTSDGFYFCKEDSAIFLDYSSTDSHSKAAGKQDALIFTLSDSSIIKIFPLKAYSSKYVPIGGASGNYWYINPVYAMHESDVEKLSKSKIIKYRIYFDQKYSDSNVKDAIASDIMDGAKCLMTKLMAGK